MKLGLVGKYTFYKQKVAMKDGKPLLDENGSQILVGEPENVAEFENLITNNGLDLIGKKAKCDYMVLSSDNTPPLITDTTINVLGISALATTGNGNLNKNVTTAPYWVSYQRVIRFGAGVATGNICKVAICNDTLGKDLFSIALVKDSNGNPTTITKLADEILDVAYELKIYLNTSDTTSTITISGNTHTVTSRLYGLSATTGAWIDRIIYATELKVYSATLTSITSGEPITAASGVDWQYGNYVNGSHKLDILLTTIPIGQANFVEGINSLFILPNNKILNYQFGISPPIMKTNTQTLKLPPITISWGRYEGAL